MAQNYRFAQKERKNDGRRTCTLRNDVVEWKSLKWFTTVNKCEISIEFVLNYYRQMKNYEHVNQFFLFIFDSVNANALFKNS
jgi:hypothetical protein